MLDSAIFLRILYADSYIKVLNKGELNPYVYLFKSYSRLVKIFQSDEKLKASTISYEFIEEKMKAAIVSASLSSYVIRKITNENDDLYESTTVEEKFWKILNKNELQQMMVDFLDEMVRKAQCLNVEVESIEFLRTFIYQIFDYMKDEVNKIKLSELGKHEHIFSLLTAMSSKPLLGAWLIHHSYPKIPEFGKTWEKTLLGTLLSISICNKKSQDYFSNARSILITDYKINEQNAWSNHGNLVNYVHNVFENLLKAGNHSKSSLLSWIGNCLQFNAGRTGEMSKYGGLDDKFSNTGRVVLDSIKNNCNLWWTTH